MSGYFVFDYSWDSIKPLIDADTSPEYFHMYTAERQVYYKKNDYVFLKCYLIHFNPDQSVNAEWLDYDTNYKLGAL